MIKTSLDWADYRTALVHKTHNLVHGKEVRKMIRNIDEEIAMLSRAEVESRRRNKHAADSILLKVNKDIELVEEFLLVAALIG